MPHATDRQSTITAESAGCSAETLQYRAIAVLTHSEQHVIFAANAELLTVADISHRLRMSGICTTAVRRSTASHRQVAEREAGERWSSNSSTLRSYAVSLPTSVIVTIKNATIRSIYLEVR